MSAVTKIIVAPVEARLDDAKVTVVEVLGYTRLDGVKRYIVSCFIEWGGYRSQVFQLDVKDGADLERKLRVELAKMKVAVMTGYTSFFTKTG